MHARILENTIGTTKAAAVKASFRSQIQEWMRGWSIPISLPQLAPVAMLLLIAFMFFSQTTGNSFGGAYQKSFELAGQTYQQGADIMIGGKEVEINQPKNNRTPTKGIFVKEK